MEMLKEVLMMHESNASFSVISSLFHYDYCNILVLFVVLFQHDRHYPSFETDIFH